MAKLKKIGILGVGAIGSEVAFFIDKKLSDKFKLESVCEMDKQKADKVLRKLKNKPKLVSLEKLISGCDIIVEASSIDTANTLLSKAKKTNKKIIVLSVGVFIKYKKLLNKDYLTSSVYIPSGAISGVDGIGALSLGKIRSLKLITSKPPASLKNVAYLKNNNIDVEKIKKERIVFQGNIKQAVASFPKNINVAAIIFLASRFKNLQVIIKVNPKLKRNVHRIEMDSSDGKLTVEVENVPSRVHSRTSELAISSTKSMLKKMAQSLKVGS